MGKPARDIMNFGNVSLAIVQYTKDENISIGELNQKGLLNGKGISIFPSGDIFIGHWANGLPVPGTRISIEPNGEFRVDEISAGEWGGLEANGTVYMKDGKFKTY